MLKAEGRLRGNAVVPAELALRPERNLQPDDHGDRAHEARGEQQLKLPNPKPPVPFDERSEGLAPGRPYDPPGAGATTLERTIALVAWSRAMTTAVTAPARSHGAINRR